MLRTSKPLLFTYFFVVNKFGTFQHNKTLDHRQVGYCGYCGPDVKLTEKEINTVFHLKTSVPGYI